VPGGNYGWPDVEGIGNDGRYIDPVGDVEHADASPSGIAIVANTIYVACLRGAKTLPAGTDGKERQPLLTDEYGRLRAVTLAPDGALWILTSNRDGRAPPPPRRPHPPPESHHAVN